METIEEIKYINRIQYLKIYEYLIKKAIYYEVFSGYEEDKYLEIHHILPKCMGGANTETNLVKVDARTHIVLHMLLAKMYPDDPKLALAVNACTIAFNESREIATKNISTRLLAEAREKAKEAMKGILHPNATQVVCFDKDYNVIKVYDYIKQTQEDGFCPSSISELCSNGKCHRELKTDSLGTHCGYYWMRLDKFSELHKEKLLIYYNNLQNGVVLEINYELTLSSTKNKQILKNVSEKTRKLISDNMKGNILTDDQKQNISNTMKDHWKNNTPPFSNRIIDPDGKIYRSIGECAKDKGVYKSTITRRLKILIQDTNM